MVTVKDNLSILSEKDLFDIFHRVDERKTDVDSEIGTEEQFEDAFPGITSDDINAVSTIQHLLFQHGQQTGALTLSPAEIKSLHDTRAEILKKYPHNRATQAMWEFFEPSPGLGQES